MLKRVDWVYVTLFILLVVLQIPIPFLAFHSIWAALLFAGGFAIILGVEVGLLRRQSVRRWRKFYERLHSEQ